MEEGRLITSGAMFMKAAISVLFGRLLMNCMETSASDLGNRECQARRSI